jgi:hypothetical protein
MQKQNTIFMGLTTVKGIIVEWWNEVSVFFFCDVGCLSGTNCTTTAEGNKNVFHNQKENLLWWDAEGAHNGP